MLNTKLESIESNLLASVSGGCHGGKKQHRQRGCGGQAQIEQVQYSRTRATWPTAPIPCNTGAPPDAGQQQPQQPQGGGGGGGYGGGLRLDFSYDPQGGQGQGQGQGY